MTQRQQFLNGIHMPLQALIVAGLKSSTPPFSVNDPSVLKELGVGESGDSRHSKALSCLLQTPPLLFHV